MTCNSGCGNKEFTIGIINDNAFIMKTNLRMALDWF